MLEKDFERRCLYLSLGSLSIFAVVSFFTSGTSVQHPINIPLIIKEPMNTIQIDLYPDHKKRGIKWREIAKKLYEAKKMKKHFATIEIQLVKKLKDISEEQSSKSGNYIFTITECKGSIDYNIIPQLADVDLEVYRKPRIKKWKLTKI